MPNEKFAGQVDEKKAKKMPTSQIRNLQAKVLSKKPNFSYLASKNAKWQPCTGIPSLSPSSQSSTLRITVAPGYAPYAVTFSEFFLGGTRMLFRE